MSSEQYAVLVRGKHHWRIHSVAFSRIFALSSYERQVAKHGEVNVLVIKFEVERFNECTRDVNLADHYVDQVLTDWR